MSTEIIDGWRQVGCEESDAVRKRAASAAPVTIGDEVYTEWRSVAGEAILRDICMVGVPHQHWLPGDADGC